mmetsp:Transcript_21865/g.70635  ORF Transcript_21865/g.70635 Transcript_21865/m.70635 type:complete len:263 (-) Transcript_21865:752-1540(-)
MMRLQVLPSSSESPSDKSVWHLSGTLASLPCQYIFFARWSLNAIMSGPSLCSLARRRISCVLESGLAMLVGPGTVHSNPLSAEVALYTKPALVRKNIWRLPSSISTTLFSISHVNFWPTLQSSPFCGMGTFSSLPRASHELPPSTLTRMPALGSARFDHGCPAGLNLVRQCACSSGHIVLASSAFSRQKGRTHSPVVSTTSLLLIIFGIHPSSSMEYTTRGSAQMVSFVGCASSVYVILIVPPGGHLFLGLAGRMHPPSLSV